jgi:xyloglucan-specific exo-beta-1,4-glucanase
VVRLFSGDGTSTGGALSIDNGKTWTDFRSHPNNAGDGSIALSADGTTFIWAPGDGQTPVISNDHAKTWKKCLGLPGSLRVVSDRVDSRFFYAFNPSTGVVLVSRDRGANFSPKAEGLAKGDGYIRAVPGQAGHIWLAAQDGLYRSIDFGTTFASINVELHGQHIGFGKAAPGQDYPAIYVQGKLRGVYGFFRSDDQGATWVRINDDRHNFAVVNAITGDPRIFGRLYLASSARGLVYGDPAASNESGQ